MPKGYRTQELAYYQAKFFHKTTSNLPPLDMNAVMTRAINLISELHHFYSTDFFFFQVDGRQFFGRKTLSPLHLDGSQKSKKCFQIQCHMIIGLVVREQLTADRSLVYYRELNPQEKQVLFDSIKHNSLIDLYFPFPYLVKGQEKVQSEENWNPTPVQVANLDGGEEVLRQYTLQFLSRFDLDNKKIFDPACSTGKFLATIKTTYPQLKAIGQDMNKSMVDCAREKNCIDELFIGNSLNSSIDEESVDFVVFRFLNISVVYSNDAVDLFAYLANKCKNNGYLIIFGHTPVHLAKEWFEMLGLTVEQSMGYNEQYDSIFQYYVLRKNSPVPQLKYEDFDSFKLTAKHQEPQKLEHGSMGLG